MWSEWNFTQFPTFWNAWIMCANFQGFLPSVCACMCMEMP
uniref:Uncharacterized protein n=1 Tax=Anguilla anguilla TaxID=7936 RepID=A0A0E9V2N8_ANGAN